MPKTKKPAVSKRKPQRKTKGLIWTEQHLAVKALMEEELHGLLHYLRSIHYLAVVLLLASIATLFYALSVIFQNDHTAVVGFLMVIFTSLTVSIISVWTLKPWIMPRFLLPIDMNELDLSQLLTLFNSPEEYLNLLKSHTQLLTEQYLIVKLRRLRMAILFFVFGAAVAILLSIAVP